jgi:hypothetical protein
LVQQEEALAEQLDKAIETEQHGREPSVRSFSSFFYKPSHSLLGRSRRSAYRTSTSPGLTKEAKG